MSVYIFSSGMSLYADSDDQISAFQSTLGDKSSLSTIVLTESTTANEIISYGHTLRNELEQIRQIFIREANPMHTKDYEKFLRMQVQLLSYVDELAQLFSSYEDAKRLTVDRGSGIKQKIVNLGMKISSIIRSYNTSGMFAYKDTLVSVPTKSSYESVVKSKLLETINTGL